MGTENAVIVSEMQSRSDAEIVSLMAEKTEELHSTKFKHALGQLTKTDTLKSLKKDIARLQTIQRQRAVKAEG